MAKPALAHERLFALRSEIDRLESQKGTALARAARESPWDRRAAGDDGLIHSGALDFDEALGGGIARAALHEIRTASTSDNGAASGFVLALGRLALDLAGTGQARRILWIA